MELFRHTQGNPADPALVLVNGLFAPLESWDGALSYLDGFNLLRYDGVGQGQSPKPDRIYHFDGLVDDLENLLSDLDWPPTFICGISNGGSVALEFARRHPHRVRAVVAADCAVEVSPLFRLKLQSWLAAHETGGPTHRFDVATPWIWGETALQQNADLIDLYRSRAADQEDQAVRGLIKGALTVNIDATGISVPTLLLTGEEDILTPPFVMDRIPITHAVRKRVPGGHASLLENPAIFGDVIVPWLKGWL